MSEEYETLRQAILGIAGYSPKETASCSEIIKEFRKNREMFKHAAPIIIDYMTFYIEKTKKGD